MREEGFAPSPAQREARRYFPRGLEQPPESYRFSMEALLLAAFVPPLPKMRLLDLGTGCGVVALAVLCRHGHVEAHGIDVQPELTAAAVRNAERLGFAHRFIALCADLASPALFARHPADIPQAAAYDLVLANPPFHSRRCGRLPQSLSRQTALFAGENTLTVFCAAAATALAPGGALAVVYPAPRREELFAALDRARLAPARILPVSPRARAPFSLLLTLARHAGPGRDESRRAHPPLSPLPHPFEDSPLVLHREKSEGGRFTPAALAFCPFLAGR